MPSRQLSIWPNVAPWFQSWWLDADEDS